MKFYTTHLNNLISQTQPSIFSCKIPQDECHRWIFLCSLHHIHLHNKVLTKTVPQDLVFLAWSPAMSKLFMKSRFVTLAEIVCTSSISKISHKTLFLLMVTKYFLIEKRLENKSCLKFYLTSYVCYLFLFCMDLLMFSSNLCCECMHSLFKINLSKD